MDCCIASKAFEYLLTTHLLHFLTLGIWLDRNIAVNWIVSEPQNRQKILHCAARQDQLFPGSDQRAFIHENTFAVINSMSLNQYSLGPLQRPVMLCFCLKSHWRSHEVRSEIAFASIKL